MKIFPAIDLFDKKAVRLYKGNYDEMTVYSENPLEIALDFQKKGAKNIHIVDLEGARDGGTPNFEVVKRIAESCTLSIEVGGGIRSMETVEKYLSLPIERVILGTSAVTDEAFLREAVLKYKEKIAVGVDIKDGYVAIRGWREKSEYSAFDFCERLVGIGVKTVIATDISKDGAMLGTNRELYKTLSEKYPINIIASGGVSSYDDISELSRLGIYGAIIGKAYYVGAIDLERAVKVENDN